MDASGINTIADLETGFQNRGSGFGNQNLKAMSRGIAQQ